MELLSGESLAELIAREGRLEPPRAVEIFIDACRGLAAAHSKGLIHGDIKPANIFLHTEGTQAKSSDKTTAKIVDFGIVSIVRAGVDDEQFQTGGIFGSPLYMSPEQFRGEKLGFGSDIYSCGCALYEALTGAPPLMGANVFATMNMHLTAIPATLSAQLAEYEGALPRRLDELVARMLAKEVDGRPQSFAEVEQELLLVQKVLADWSKNAPVISRDGRKQLTAVPSVSQEEGSTATKMNLAGRRKLFAVAAIILSSVTAIIFVLGRKPHTSEKALGIQENIDKSGSKTVLPSKSIDGDAQPGQKPSAKAASRVAKIVVPSGSFDISSGEDIKTNRRSFKLPQGYSLGVFTYKENEDESASPAEGLIHLPFKNLLTLGAAAGASPHLLNGFKPNSLYRICVRSGSRFDDRHL